VPFRGVANHSCPPNGLAIAALLRQPTGSIMLCRTHPNSRPRPKSVSPAMPCPAPPTPRPPCHDGSRCRLCLTARRLGWIPSHNSTPASSLHCCKPFVFLTLRAVCGDIARAAKTECCQEPSSMVLARPTGTGRTQHSRASFFHTQLFYV
jgi:hypothetical protein